MCGRNAIGDLNKELSRNLAITNSKFIMYLNELKKQWILKKIGTKIYGDVSMRCIGSNFFHDSIFEIVYNPKSESVSLNIPENLKEQLSLEITINAKGNFDSKNIRA